MIKLVRILLFKDDKFILTHVDELMTHVDYTMMRISGVSNEYSFSNCKYWSFNSELPKLFEYQLLVNNFGWLGL